MSNFKVRTEIVYGELVEKELDKLQHERIWFVCDAFLVDTPLLVAIKEKLEILNEVELFSRIVPDPPLEYVAQGIASVIRFQPTVIVVVGGGSAIDTAKAVRYFIDGNRGVTINRFIAMPTTSGTGSEVTSVAVITDTAAKVKYPIVDKSLVPDVALLIPELVRSCPKTVTAYSGMDVLTHACEALVANNSSAFSDSFAEKAIEYVFEYLPRCYQDGQDLYAREKMHEAACLAGLAFESAGLGVCHAISHQIGGRFHYPHGLINAILLPKVIICNAKDPKVARKYATAAKKIAVAKHASTDISVIEEFIREITTLSSKLGCADNLSSLNFNKRDYIQAIPPIIENTKKDFTYAGNPVELTDKEIAEVCISII